MWNGFGFGVRAVLALSLVNALGACGGNSSTPANTGGAGGSLPEGGASGSGPVAGDSSGGADALAGAAGSGPDSTSTVGEGFSLVHHLELPFAMQNIPATFVVKSGDEFGVSDGLTLAALS